MLILGKLRKKSKSPSIFSNDPDCGPTIKTGHLGWNKKLPSYEKELSFTPIFTLTITFIHGCHELGYSFQEVDSTRIHHGGGNFLEQLFEGMNDGTVTYKTVTIPKNPVYENDFYGDKVAFTGNFKVVKGGRRVYLSTCTKVDMKGMKPLTVNEEKEITLLRNY